MASRRADPHHSTSDVEWDFSFAGAPLHRPPTGEAQPNPTWNEAEQPEWDFSFAGPPIKRSSEQAATAVFDEVAQSWDFTFAGPKIDRSLPAPESGAGRVEPDPEWDFSFVDGGPDTPPAPPRPVPDAGPDLDDEPDVVDMAELTGGLDWDHGLEPRVYIRCGRRKRRAA